MYMGTMEREPQKAKDTAAAVDYNKPVQFA